MLKQVYRPTLFSSSNKWSKNYIGLTHKQMYNMMDWNLGASYSLQECGKTRINFEMSRFIGKTESKFYVFSTNLTRVHCRPSAPEDSYIKNVCDKRLLQPFHFTRWRWRPWANDEWNSQSHQMLFISRPVFANFANPGISLRQHHRLNQGLY